MPTKRVLVLGDNDLACLTVIRSMGRAGMDVHLVGWYPYKTARVSRYVSRVFDFGHPETETARFVEGVRQVVAQNGYDVVFPVLDAAMIPLMDVADELNRHSKFAAPDRRGFEISHNKVETIRLAQSLGIDCPKTTFVSILPEVETLEPPAAFPIILKPAWKGAPQKAHSIEDMRQKLRQLVPHTSVLVQEFCPGYGVGINVICDHGEVFAATQMQRRHEPPWGGAPSFCESVPINQTLLKNCSEMCQQMHYHGVAMFEFKHDWRKGRYAMMEMNGRFWAALPLSLLAGVDFPLLLYEMLVHGKRTQAKNYRTRCFARHTRYDFWWFRENFRTPADNPELLHVSWKELLSEIWPLLTGRERWFIESFSDPMPGIYCWAELVKDILAAVKKRIIKGGKGRREAHL